MGNNNRHIAPLRLKYEVGSLKLVPDNDLDRLLVTLDVDVQSFALCKVQKGRRLLTDAVDAIMVHYVLSGTHFMTIDGHEPLVGSAGCIVIIPAGMAPKVAARAGAAIDMAAKEHTTLTRDGVLLMDATDGGEGDLRFLSGIVQASFSGSFGLFDNLTEPMSQRIDAPLIAPAFELMLDEVGSARLGARALTSALMKSCFVLVLRLAWFDGAFGKALLGNLSDRRLASAVSTVLDRPAESHSVASLAAVAGMSRSSFCRTFQQAFSTSPMEFVTKTRLHHAAEMLKSTPLPVKVIAANVGFCSRSHFSHVFSNAYGQDPTSFRASHRKLPLDPPEVNASNIAYSDC